MILYFNFLAFRSFQEIFASYKKNTIKNLEAQTCWWEHCYPRPCWLDHSSSVACCVNTVVAITLKLYIMFSLLVRGSAQIHHVGLDFHICLMVLILDWGFSSSILNLTIIPRGLFMYVCAWDSSWSHSSQDIAYLSVQVLGRTRWVSFLE